MKAMFGCARVVPERRCIELVGVMNRSVVVFVDISDEAFDAIKADYRKGANVMMSVPGREKQYRMLNAMWSFDVVLGKEKDGFCQAVLSEVGRDELDRGLNVVIADFLVNGSREIRDFEVISRKISHHDRDSNAIGGQRDQNVYRIGYVGSEIVLEGNPKQLCQQIDQLRAEGKIPAAKYSAARNSIIGKLMKGADQAEGWHLVK